MNDRKYLTSEYGRHLLFEYTTNCMRRHAPNLFDSLHEFAYEFEEFGVRCKLFRVLRFILSAVRVPANIYLIVFLIRSFRDRGRAQYVSEFHVRSKPTIQLSASRVYTVRFACRPAVSVALPRLRSCSVALDRRARRAIEFSFFRSRLLPRLARTDDFLRFK